MLLPLQRELLLLLEGKRRQGGQGSLQQLAQIQPVQGRCLLVVDASLSQQLADQPIAAIEGQQHLAQRLLPSGIVLGRHHVLAVNAQHR
ncbi:hypothetical protein D3C80_1611930 [compost metagenome]